MTLTAKTVPPEFNPVYNRIEYCYDSDQTAQPNFKYVFKVYVDVTLIATFKVPPEPNISDLGVQDVSRSLAAYIEEMISQYNSTASFAYALDLPIRKFRVDVLEQWDVAGVPTENEESLVTGSDKYVWSGVFDHHDWIHQINLGTPYYDWLIDALNQASWLTPNQDNNIVSINDLGWHYILIKNTAQVDYVEIKTYDSAGSLIQTVQLANGLTMSVPAARMLSVATAPQSLNNYVGAFAAGSAPIITSSVATYTVQIFETTPTAVTDLLSFTIDESCRYDTYRIHFLNKLGGFDSYNFRARSQESTEFQRKSYTRAENHFTGTGELSYQHENDGTTDYYIKSRDKIKLRSEYLTEAEKNWLKELQGSPLIFLEFIDPSGTNNFKPVKMLTNRWVKNTTSIDKLFKLELDIDLAHENFRQRR